MTEITKFTRTLNNKTIHITSLCHIVITYTPKSSSYFHIQLISYGYTRGLRGFSGIVISGIIGLDIFFLSFISCASMNPARSLAPALLSGSIGDLWLYWSATFIETSIVAFVLQRKFTT